MSKRTIKDVRCSELFRSDFDFHFNLNMDTGIKQN